LYQAGADYVLRPNLTAARHLLEVVEHFLRGEEGLLKDQEMEELSRREEVLT
jgi:hypothetical protein